MLKRSGKSIMSGFSFVTRLQIRAKAIEKLLNFECGIFPSCPRPSCEPSVFGFQALLDKSCEPRLVRLFHRSELHRKPYLIRLFDYLCPQVDWFIIGKHDFQADQLLWLDFTATEHKATEIAQTSHIRLLLTQVTFPAC